MLGVKSDLRYGLSAYRRNCKVKSPWSQGRRKALSCRIEPPRLRQSYKNAYTDVPLHGEQRPFGGHAGALHAAMADGTVRFMRSSIEPSNLAAAITIAGEEPVDLD